MIKLRQNERNLLISAFRAKKLSGMFCWRVDVMTQNSSNIIDRLVRKNLINIEFYNPSKYSWNTSEGRLQNKPYCYLADNFPIDVQQYIEECIVLDALQH